MCVCVCLCSELALRGTCTQEKVEAWEPETLCPGRLLAPEIVQIFAKSLLLHWGNPNPTGAVGVWAPDLCCVGSSKLPDWV